MLNLPDEHAEWLCRHRGLVLSFLEVGERVLEPAWAMPPWLVLWPVVGQQRRWLLIGTFPDTRETAIAIARRFDPALDDDDAAERDGRLPTAHGLLTSELHDPREVVRRMLADIDAVAGRLGNRSGTADRAALLRSWVDDDALWPTCA